MNKRDSLYYTHQCRHFTGIHHDTCEKGIAYSSVRDHQPGYKMARWPCLVWKSEMAQTKCDQLSPYTAEESIAMMEEGERRITQMLSDIANDICPTCGVKVEKKQQVGSCVYGHPCGHRLYQGKA